MTGDPDRLKNAGIPITFDLQKIALTNRKYRLRTTVVVPFMVEIVGAVGLVGYLSYRNGQQAVNDLANQLQHEVSARVYERVQTYLEAPPLMNQINEDAAGRLSISGQHEETIVVRQDGQIERIETMDLGFPIGLDSEIADWISHRLVELEPGDGVVLYTDGITEAEDINKGQYGLERLCEVVSPNWHKSAEQIKQEVIDDLRQFIGQQRVLNDITLVVLKRKG